MLIIVLNIILFDIDYFNLKEDRAKEEKQENRRLCNMALDFVLETI